MGALRSKPSAEEGTVLDLTWGNSRDRMCREKHNGDGMATKFKVEDEGINENFGKDEQMTFGDN